MDHGTLRHFRDILRRVAVGKDIKKDVNACIDLLVTVVKGHWIAYACKELGIKEPTDHVSDEVLPERIRTATDTIKKVYLDNLAKEVLANCTVLTQSFCGKEIPDSNDGIFNYGRVLCHYGSLIMEFLDSWSEGDGGRISR